MIRGAVVSHPRYAGRRVFGAGLNLTHLYHGRLDFLFFVTRDLGYVNKLFRGLSSDEHRPAEPEQTTEKLWVAAVETFAIGGACQILHTVDHVIASAARGSTCPRARRASSPAPPTCASRARSATGWRGRRSSPGSSSKRERRTATCSATRWSTRPDEMDAAVARRVEALTSSGLVNAAGNRRALRVGLGAARRSSGSTWRRSAASRPTATSAPRSCGTSNSTGTRMSAASEPAIWSPAEQLPRDELRALQLARLRATFGLELDSLDGLADLPFTDQVRSCARHIRSGCCASRSHRSRGVHASSGTHGKPTVVGYTAADLEAWTELMARCMTMAGVRPRDARPQREHLRPLHRRPRLPSGRRADRRAGRTGLRRD